MNSQSSSDDKEIHQNGTTDGVPSIMVTANSVEENVNAEELLLDENIAQEEKCRSWKEWLKTPFFYKVIIEIILLSKRFIIIACLLPVSCYQLSRLIH